MSGDLLLTMDLDAISIDSKFLEFIFLHTAMWAACWIWWVSWWNQKKKLVWASGSAKIAESLPIWFPPTYSSYDDCRTLIGESVFVISKRVRVNGTCVCVHPAIDWLQYIIRKLVDALSIWPLWLWTCFKLKSLHARHISIHSSSYLLCTRTVTENTPWPGHQSVTG